MKHKFLNLNIISLIILGILNVIPLSAQIRFCDTCKYTYKQEKPNFAKTLYGSYDTSGIFNINYYDKCEDVTSKKIIFWTHGLAGSVNSWQNARNWSDSFYKAFNASSDYSSYEFNFNQVTDIYSNKVFENATSLNQSFPKRCKSNDFVIAHSQGGLVARYLDYKWETDDNRSFGPRQFNGIVTFGTPNAGANIALTMKEHRLYVQKMVNSIVFIEANSIVYDLTSKFSNSVKYSLLNATTNLDEFIDKTFAPIGLWCLYSGSFEEMAPKSSIMNALTNFKSRVHRVAFVGEEEAPENWRVFDEFLHQKSFNYPSFQANNDDNTLKIMENIRAEHEKALITLNEGIKNLKTGRLLTFGMVNNNKISILNNNKNRRNLAIDWLNNANTEWRYLIGSFHKDSFMLNKFDTSYNLSFQSIGNPIQNKEYKGFKTYQSALDYYNSLPFKNKKNPVITINLGKIRMFFPSDGVVLCKSQIAFPGIRKRDTNIMLKTNNMQMLNCTETQNRLKALFLGVEHDNYFKTLKK